MEVMLKTRGRIAMEKADKATLHNKYEGKYFPKNQIVLNAAALGVVLSVYILTIFLCKGIERQVRDLLIIIILSVTSVYDIRENKVPLFALLGILGINLLRTTFIFFDLTTYLICLVVLAVLFVFYTINKSLIGLGDILLISFCVQALLSEIVLSFLFTTFLFSSIVGLVKCMREKDFRGVSIPMTPCIAAAFLFQII